jgi:hypothetical protein
MKKLILSLIVLGLASTAFKCDKRGVVGNMPEAVRAAAKMYPGTYVLAYDVKQTTPKGAVHYGKTAISPEQLALIDEGIDELRAATLEDGFKEEFIKPHSFYHIFTPVHPCIPSPEQRIPSMVVNAGEGWDGSEFDQYNTKGSLSSPFIDDRGVRQVYVKDGISVVFAPERVVGFGTPGSTYQVGMMQLCPDAEVLKAGTRHGGDHIQLSNFPYAEDFRVRPPYDVWVWFNWSLFHGPDSGHPLLPRNGRRVEQPASKVAGDLAPKASLITKADVPAEVAEIARKNGVEVSGESFTTSTDIIHPVR